MQAHVHIDLSEFERFQAHVRKVAEEESIAEVGKTHGRIIQELTAQGLDANRNTFHDYNPEYAIYGRLKQGYPTSPKDLRKMQGRLYDFEVEDDTLTVKDNGNARVIAAGQMSGAGGKWGYQHDFLDVSDETNETAADELIEFLELEL